MPGKSDRACRWQRLFRGQESELGQLRRWLTELLPGGPGRDDLISVAVELGTNAVQHSASGDGGWFTVEVASLGPVLRVSVTDEGAERGPCLTEDPPAGLALDSPADLHPDPDPVLGLNPDLALDLSLDLGPETDSDPGTRCDRGRGLLIVRALSLTCGMRGNAGGRTVWAEVAQAPDPAPAEAPAPAQAPDQAEAAPSPRQPANGQPGTANGQGRSSRPSASSAMAISRTL